MKRENLSADEIESWKDWKNKGKPPKNRSKEGNWTLESGKSPKNKRFFCTKVLEKNHNLIKFLKMTLYVLEMGSQKFSYFPSAPLFLN